MALSERFCYKSRKCSLLLRNRYLIRIFISMSVIIIVFIAYSNLVSPALVHSNDATGFKKRTQTIEFGNIAPKNTRQSSASESNLPKWMPATIRLNDTGLKTMQTQTKGLSNSSPKKALQRTVSTTDDPRWMPLDKGPVTFFVYAAHYDDVEPTPFVHIQVSVSRPKGKCSVDIPVQCLYFEDDIYQPTGLTVTKIRHVVALPDGDGSCKGAVVKCPLLSPQHRPQAVALVISNNTDQPDITAANTQVSSVLHVNYGTSNDRQQSGETMGMGGATHSTAAKEEQKRYSITRCYPALYSFTDTSLVLQNVEIGLALGINHFVFYNHSILNPKVNALLRHYQQIGVAEVLDWHFSVGMKVSHNHNQFSTVVDCHHRHTRTSRFILFSDLDEVPLPRNTTNLVSFLTEQSTQQADCGAFRFFNTFFDTQEKASRPSSSQKKLPPSSLARAPQNLQGNRETRETRPSPDTPGLFDDRQDSWEELAQRHWLKFFTTSSRENYVLTKQTFAWANTPRQSKQVIIPGRVEEISVHTVFAFRGPYQQCAFPPNVALLNHYRSTMKNQHTQDGYVQDLSLIRLAPLVMPRIRRTLDRLNWTHATDINLS